MTYLTPKVDTGLPNPTAPLICTQIRYLLPHQEGEHSMCRGYFISCHPAEPLHKENNVKNGVTK